VDPNGGQEAPAPYVLETPLDIERCSIEREGEERREKNKPILH
jgi:hypothetical protein